MKPKNPQISQMLMQFYAQPVAKVSLELFFSIAAVIIFALFAIRPTLLIMSDLVKEIQDKRELNAKLGEKIASLSSARDRYAIAQPQLPTLDQALPNQPNFDQAILIIEKIASEQNLIIADLAAQEIPKEIDEATTSGKTRVGKSISVTVIGDYPTIRQFVQQIGQAQRSMMINSIVFRTSDVDGKKQLRATITISIQYFGVNPELNALTSPAPTP